MSETTISTEAENKPTPFEILLDEVKDKYALLISKESQCLAFDLTLSEAQLHAIHDDRMLVLKRLQQANTIVMGSIALGGGILVDQQPQIQAFFSQHLQVEDVIALTALQGLTYLAAIGIGVLTAQYINQYLNVRIYELCRQKVTVSDAIIIRNAMKLFVIDPTQLEKIVTYLVIYLS